MAQVSDSTSHTDAPVLEAASLRLPPEHPWRRLPAIGMVLAALGLGGSLALGLAGPAARPQLWHSWLYRSLALHF